MNTLWILLWVSSGASCEFPGINEWEAHYSIRQSSAAIYEWRDALEKHGKGFNFQIIEGHFVEDKRNK